MPKSTTCSIRGCDRPHLARRWCRLHYGRWRSTGDPLGKRERRSNLKPMSSDEIAYVAGWLEGEGSFSTARMDRGYGVYYYPRVTGTSTDEDTLLRLHTITGVGNVHGPHTIRSKDGFVRKVRWDWQVTQSADAVALMEAVRPWMGKRRTEALDEALSLYRDSRAGRPHQSTDHRLNIGIALRASPRALAYYARRWPHRYGKDAA